MSVKVFEEKNDVVRRSSEKFYLDTRTADLKFMFGSGTDHTECVPAHKILLSIGSPVFETMFYGSLKEKPNIPIVDASADAFKEFSQFFYLDKVRLKSDNIIDVTNLCKKYQLTEGLRMCENPLKRTLGFNVNEMCSGYEIAILLELDNVIESCEQNIKINANEIVRSNSFTECNRKIIGRILKLVAVECNASVIVDACIAWAKAECRREQVRPTAVNLKMQLAFLFEQMPFANLSASQFARFIRMYKGFFNEDDLETIILKVLTNKTTNVPQNEQKQFFGQMLCDRRILGSFVDGYAWFNSPVSLYFNSSTKLLLTGFYCTKLERSDFSQSLDINCNMSFVIGCNEPLITKEIMLSCCQETHIVLQRSTIIDPHIEYGIHLKLNNPMQNIRWTKIPHARLVRIDDGVEIHFDSLHGIIDRLVFNKIID